VCNHCLTLTKSVQWFSNCYMQRDRNYKSNAHVFATFLGVHKKLVILTIWYSEWHTRIQCFSRLWASSSTESYTSYFNTFINTAFIHLKGLTSYGVRLYLLLIIIYSKIQKLTMEFIISIFQSKWLSNNANYHPVWKMFLVSFSGSANIIARTTVSIHNFLRLIPL